jgi:copper resistance protein D
MFERGAEPPFELASRAMTVAFVVASFIRWIGLAALATLVGSLLLDVWVLPREPTELAAVRGRLRRLGMACVVTVVATTIGELLTRVQTMAGGELGAAVQAIPAALTRTHFGKVWIARFVLLALLAVVGSFALRAARVTALVLALGVTITTTLTGHAADWGDLTLSSAIDWLHVLAMSAWTGGVMSLAVTTLGPARAWLSPVLGSVLRPFSRLAGVCLTIVVITGVYNAWVQLPGPSALWTTFYGRVLAVKLLLVLLLTWWAALSRYTIVPRLNPHHSSGAGARLFRLARWAFLGSPRVRREALPSRFAVYARWEAGLILVVLAATAILVDTTPARHAHHAAHAVVMEPGPFRVTMEELHERGGVPKDWVFVPPEGDAARGREIFVRLGCPACHRVSPEEPAGSRPGPDLIGVGQHHPTAYIFESILNPNAVIIQGPGYTGPDGKSIMPDYRGKLSVNDLLDLVTYLKSL